ncbi:MAG: hypothetical protein HZA53_06300 [Planctomycetes bacterium]|nr:hypothetical protein [Planctomycetota bacterium]
MERKPEDECREDGADPFLEEIRRLRMELSEEHGNDVRRLGEYLMQRQREHAELLVREPAPPTYGSSSEPNGADTPER